LTSTTIILDASDKCGNNQPGSALLPVWRGASTKFLQSSSHHWQAVPPNLTWGSISAENSWNCYQMLMTSFMDDMKEGFSFDCISYSGLSILLLMPFRAQARDGIGYAIEQHEGKFPLALFGMCCQNADLNADS
jgi:hypothetical protein